MANDEILRVARLQLKLDGAAEYKADLATASASLQAATGQLKLYEEKNKLTGNTLDGFRKKSELLNAQVAAQEKKVATLTAVWKQATDQYGEGSKEANATHRELVNGQVKLEKYKNQVALNNKEIEKLEFSWKKAGETVKKAGEKISGVGDKLSRTVTPVIAGLATAGIKFAADAQAREAQFSQAFGDMAGNAEAAVNKIADDTGSLPNRLKPAFTQMAAFAKTGGMETADALELAERATKAAADSSAFYDKTLEQTTESLQSFLKGNYANDAALGISATETTRNTKANELYGKSFINLSEAQKQLTLLAMVEEGNKLSGALGQAARESDTLTNQMGNLEQQAKDTLAQIAAPLIEPTIDVLKTLGDVLGDVAEWFGGLDESSQKAIITMAGVAAAAGPVLSVGGRIVSTAGELATKFAALKESGSLLSMVLTGPAGLIALLALLAGAAVIYGINADTAANFTDKLNKQAKTLKDETEKSVSGIKASGDAAKEYAEELKKLNEIENKSADEKKRIKDLVMMLNDLYPEMGLEIDDLTGGVKDMTRANAEYIDSLTRVAIEQKYSSEYSNVLDKQIEATERRVQAQLDFDAVLKETGLTEQEATKWLDENTTAMGRSYDANAVAISQSKDKVRQAKLDLEEYTQAESDSEKALAEITSRKEKVLAEYGEKVQETYVKQAETTENLHADLEKSAEKHMKAMGGIEDEGVRKSEITAAQVKKNLEAQIKDYQNWGINIQKLSARVPEDVLTELQKLGPQYAPLIADLNTLTDEELSDWVATWQAKSEAATVAAMLEMGGLPAEIRDALLAGRITVGEAAKLLANRATDAIAEVRSGAYTSGKNAALGLRDGINDYAYGAVKAASSMGTRVTASLRKVMQEQSPSKVTKLSGKNFAMGLAIGIDENAELAVKAAGDMAKKVADAGTPDPRLASVSMPDVSAAKVGTTPIITVQNMTVRDDMDINLIANELDRLSRRNTRGAGYDF